MYQHLQFKILFHSGIFLMFTENILSSVLGTWYKKISILVRFGKFGKFA